MGDIFSSKQDYDIRSVLRLREELEGLDADVRYWTEVIEDFSHYDSEGGGQSFGNPKENAIVRRADALSSLDGVRMKLSDAESVLTERIAHLDVRAEVRRATYLFFVQGYSLDYIGELMVYSKTQVHRLKEQGRESYEERYVQGSC